jgi:UDP-N-acetyl-D-mannosaminuronic acid dehydrogenase
MKTQKEFDIVIVGGLGHVGLPLGLSFANEGLSVCLYDVDAKKAEEVKKGKMPFIEYGAEPILDKVLKNGRFHISLDAAVIAEGKQVIIAVGTPVDEYMSPKVKPFFEVITQIKKYLDPQQTIIIRSTVFPRTCRQVLKFLNKEAKQSWKVAYCPERIVQGHSIKELKELPQIIAGLSKDAEEEACNLFKHLSPKIIRVTIEEAELAKLFTNAWRYIQFAMANQFYMIAHEHKVDFNSIRNIMMDSYGRVASLPMAGFAAGPCLLKDTMQLMASSNNNFFLGNAAMMVNEGLPNFVVEELKSRYDLSTKKVGILGMAFKADIDDTRDSLSYKLVKLLKFNGAEVFCSDHFVKDPSFLTKEEVIRQSDILIVGVPHSDYKDLLIPDRVDVIDLWGVTKQSAKKKDSSPVLAAAKSFLNNG